MHKLNEQAYRCEFVRANIFHTVAFQLRELRRKHNMTQQEVADLAGMKQSRISQIESAENRALTIETLCRLADVFDISLNVMFAPFSELVKWREGLNEHSFKVKSYKEEKKKR